MANKNKNALPVTNQSKIKQVIDELYQKEKRYVKQYIREDLIHNQNQIFNLEKCYKLQTASGVEKHTKEAINSNDRFRNIPQMFSNEVSDYVNTEKFKSFGGTLSTKNRE